MTLARPGGAAHASIDMRGPRLFLAALAALAISGEAAAECVDAPDLAAYQELDRTELATGVTRRDRTGRVVAPVTVNGQGPFRFIIDTGANRSALSDGLASRLGLASTTTDEVHSVHGVTVAPLVNVSSLQYGDVAVGARDLPILNNQVLGGEQGLLGVDGMGGRRLRMDFERNCIEIITSRGAPRLRGWATLRGEMRFGHLVVVRGLISGVHVSMLVDTGSNYTLANPALQQALNARPRRRDPLVAYTAGQPIVLQNAILIPRMTMSDLEVRNVTAFAGDFHIFRLWNLVEEPTLLIGMDVISQSRGLAIDYQRGTVHLRLHEDVGGGRVSTGSLPRQRIQW